MQAADGLLGRVKPPLGQIDAHAARQLADAARRCGNGQIDLTNRGALQVRGLSEASLPEFQAAVLALGLASPDPAVERRRNVLVSPLVTSIGEALAAALEQWIAEDHQLAALPAKFGFVIEATGRDPHPLHGDISFSLELGPPSDQLTWRVAIPSGLAWLTQAPLDLAQTITRQFLTLAEKLDPPPRRLIELVRRCGTDALGLAGQESAGDMGRPAPAASASFAGPLNDAFALGAPFGALQADDLQAAAQLAEGFGDGSLRLSPWRALVLPNVSNADDLSQAARLAGFITDPADARLSVATCAGAPACASASAPTRTHAAQLGGPLPGLVHLSGCSKGCAHPTPAPYTFVATPNGYDLVRGGKAADRPDHVGFSLEQVVHLLAAEAAPGHQ